MSQYPAIQPEILQKASEWQARLWSEDVSPQNYQDFNDWRAVNPEHERAWQCLQSLNNKLDQLPVHDTHTILMRLEQPDQSSGLIKGTGLLVVAIAIVLAVSQSRYGQSIGADYVTNTGELRQLDLSDGTHLVLDSASAVDIDYSGTKRLIHLRYGQVYVVSGHHGKQAEKPLIVSSEQGDVQALGTRFIVRQEKQHSLAAVAQGRVEVRLATAKGVSRQLSAGQQLVFTDHQITMMQPATDAIFGWTTGKLLAEQMPVCDMVSILGRYRHGITHCDVSNPQLKISGVFSLTNTDQTFDQLASLLPVQVNYRTGYWVTVSDAK